MRGGGLGEHRNWKGLKWTSQQVPAPKPRVLNQGSEVEWQRGWGVVVGLLGGRSVHRWVTTA